MLYVLRPAFVPNPCEHRFIQFIANRHLKCYEAEGSQVVRTFHGTPQLLKQFIHFLTQGLPEIFHVLIVPHCAHSRKQG